MLWGWRWEANRSVSHKDYVNRRSEWKKINVHIVTDWVIAQVVMALVMPVDSDVIFVVEVVIVQNVMGMGFHSKVPKRMKKIGQIKMTTRR